MMGFSWNSAVAADFQGQQLLAKLDAQKAETADVQMQTEARRATVDMEKRKAEGEKQVAQWISADTTAANAPEINADDTAKRLQKGALQMASQGNMTGYTTMSKMAQDSLVQAKEARVERDAAAAAAKETAAVAAIGYLANPTPENEKIVTSAAIKAGYNAVNMPQPGTPAYLAFAKNLTTAATSSKDQLTFAENVRKADREFAEKQEENKRRDADRDAARAQTAAYQQGSLAMQAGNLEIRKLLAGTEAAKKEEAAAAKVNAAEFKQANKLTTDATAVAKPYLKDLQMAENVQGLLAAGGSPAADKQINQALTSLMTGTGKATNLYYKDNKNFGNIAQKFEGFFSQTFTGRYSDEQRKQIYEMTEQMKKTVIEPALTNIEKDARAKAKLFGLKDDSIEAVRLPNDFERRTPTGALPQNRRAGDGVEAPAKGTEAPKGDFRSEAGAKNMAQPNSAVSDAASYRKEIASMEQSLKSDKLTPKERQMIETDIAAAKVTYNREFGPGSKTPIQADTPTTKPTIAPAFNEGQTATNKTTGQKMIFSNGTWKPQ